MYLSPNFRIDEDLDSQIVTPLLNDDGVADRYMAVENTSKSTIVVENEIERDKIVLAPLDGLKTMYLYPNGKIKIER